MYLSTFWTLVEFYSTYIIILFYIASIFMFLTVFIYVTVIFLEISLQQLLSTFKIIITLYAHVLLFNFSWIVCKWF